MCKDLDRIFATEKDPRSAVYNEKEKKWHIPKEEDSKRLDLGMQSPPFSSFDLRKSTDLEIHNDIFSPKESKNNPIKSLGTKMRGIIKWF